MDATIFQPGRHALEPVTHRIALLDVLRGFAILGILLLNIMGFSGWFFLSPEKAAALPGAAVDTALMYVLVALIEGKFYSLFSLLFGIGFAVLIQRAEAKDTRPTPILLRRYFGLLAIGLIHSLLIWFGDILTLYALLGFVLLACRGLSDRALVRCTIGLLLLPIPLYGFVLALQPPPAPGDSGGLPPVLMAAIQAFQSGSYSQIVAGNAVITAFGWLRRLILMFYPRVFGMFLLGFALSRMGVFRAPEQHAGLIRAFARYGLFVGLPASILYSALDQHGGMLPLTMHGFIRTICESIGTPLLCLGYTAWITMLFQNPRWRSLLLWFAPVGRMALSNYLLQSIVGVLLFYGIGGGLFMRVSAATALSIALAVFTAQVVLSRLYFKSFQQGPAESLWRRLTYGRRATGYGEHPRIMKQPR
jgi:uncharacterized protein